jgi:hypothetical protein
MAKKVISFATRLEVEKPDVSRTRQRLMLVLLHFLFAVLVAVI